MQSTLHTMKILLTPSETSRLLIFDGNIEHGMMIAGFQVIPVAGGASIPGGIGVVLHSTDEPPAGINPRDNRQFGWWWFNGDTFNTDARHGVVNPGATIIGDLFVTNLDPSNAWFVIIEAIKVPQSSTEGILRLIKEHSQATP